MYVGVMIKKERMGKVVVPQWWLDKALPILASKASKDRDIAREASIVAGRKNPWGPSAISKFRTDAAGRTIVLTNAISIVIQIPQPFLAAPTEAAAIEMALVVKREQAHLDELHNRLSAIDGVAKNEITAATIDARKQSSVLSSSNVDAGGRRDRVGRARRGRS